MGYVLNKLNYIKKYAIKKGLGRFAPSTLLNCVTLLYTIHLLLKTQTIIAFYQIHNYVICMRFTGFK